MAAVAASTSVTSMSPRPVITLFTSVRNIGPALEKVSGLPFEEIEDENAPSRHGAVVEFDPSRLQESSLSKLRDAEILVTDPAVLAKLLTHTPPLLPNLKWCQSTFAGVDPLFKTKGLTLPLPFTLTRCAGVFGPRIAEWCIAQMIAHERRFDLMRLDQSRQEWAGSPPVLQYRNLSDLTLSILGCGDIGMSIARAAKAFGMKVVGYSTRPKVSEALDESVTNITEALQACDYIVNILPSTEKTRNLLTLETFQMANSSHGGKSPVFVNVGRGDVTSSSTILAALDANHISAAILDVFEQEPLPPSNPLWKHPKVTISPHVSGVTGAQDIPNVVVDQYERYISGRPLQYIVDWDKSY